MEKLEKYAPVLTVVISVIMCIIALIALIPDFGQWLDPREPTTRVSKTPSPSVGATGSQPVREGKDLDSWISYDENMTVGEDHFYWSGPEVSRCIVTLRTEEFIVGTADRFGDKVNSPPESTRCVAFALLGPLEIEISINDGGGGNFHSAATSYQESIHLQPKQRELDAHVSCNMNARGYNTIECSQEGCVYK